MIAAGEVVERPASVIKELVENAVDAGATKITVEIKNGGVTFMRVTDNGCGMSREDAPTAFLRHATSKISCAEDLGGISTMGFRGEALAAISSVSKIDLLTRAASEELGVSMRVEAGNVMDIQPAGLPPGNHHDHPGSVLQHPCPDEIPEAGQRGGKLYQRRCPAAGAGPPEIAFRFLRDGKPELTTPGDGKLPSAIYAGHGPCQCKRDGGGEVLFRRRDGDRLCGKAHGQPGQPQLSAFLCEWTLCKVQNDGLCTGRGL